MGKVIVQEETTINPITLIGKEAGVCYGSNVSDNVKNYKRGLVNIKSGHGRTMEYPQIYLILDGYSARVMRELYTHIGGAPTRLQASTRYIDYADFEYITPPSIKIDPALQQRYDAAMKQISEGAKDLISLGVNKEDVANLYPLGMTTKVVLRTNLRNLVDMSHQRLCTRAYWEYRELMMDIMEALMDYSDEWKELIPLLFIPKCEINGYCTEHNCCGRKQKKG